jgi:hypothetical protein
VSGKPSVSGRLRPERLEHGSGTSSSTGSARPSTPTRCRRTEETNHVGEGPTGFSSGDLVPRKEDEDNLLILRLPINGDNHAHDPAVLVHDDRSAFPRRGEERFAFVHGIKQIFKALQIALL